MAAEIPHYARPLSPGRRLEGPPERFGARAVWTQYRGTCWRVYDRELGILVTPLVDAEGTARDQAHALNRPADGIDDDGAPCVTDPPAAENAATDGEEG